jgi:lipoyl(octanoyl) transferase
LIIRNLGIQPYQLIWEKMQFFTDKRDHVTEDEIWLLQHPGIYTLGRNSTAEHLLNPRDIPVIAIDRGGQVTYHGPGQLIAYLMIDIKRLEIGVRELVTRIENALIHVLANYDVDSYAKKDAPGVYTQQGKIAALGLRIRKSCSFHGLSLNVKMNLQPFTGINPCGYKGLTIVQLADYSPDITLPSCTKKLKQSLIQEIYQ